MKLYYYRSLRHEREVQQFVSPEEKVIKMLKSSAEEQIDENEEEYIIVDYKTKEIGKDIYYDQVSGYMKYIKRISNKKVSGYIYSIKSSSRVSLPFAPTPPLF